MLEVEIKARISERERVVKSLLEAGFSFVASVEQDDEYYSGIDRDFSRTDEALRLRATTSDLKRVYAITYKGPKLDKASKTRIEHEIQIGDIGAMGDLLRALGHESVYIVRKRREYYCLGNITACVDNIEGLGDFIELETDEGEADRLFSLLDRLGISRDACVRESYLELLLSSRNE